MTAPHVPHGIATVAAATAAWQLLIIASLHTIPRMGRAGRSLADGLIRAPGLDAVVAALTWLPWVFAALLAGPRGLLAAVAAQVLSLLLWVLAHEYRHAPVRRGPRIVKVINRTVGRWQNHTALWVSALGLPGFWYVRFGEICLYPFCVRLLGFPRYNHGEWIAVSRQKFDGLVGHDLIWCLYCDWMTGVYSLGAEMLRNVETFWCPIRFRDDKKCDNCRSIFPDVDGGWVPADKSIADVAAKLETMFADGNVSWFGHPSRVTINGKPIPSVPLSHTVGEGESVSAEPGR